MESKLLNLSIANISVRNKNYYTFLKVNQYLELLKKDLEWLYHKTNFNRALIYGVYKGTNYFTPEQILAIAKVLRENGCLISSPKVLMDPANFSTKNRGFVIKNNISWLMKKYSISRLSLSEGTKICQGTLEALINNRNQANYHYLIMIFNYFKSKHVFIRNPLDLIYFPEWGEKEDSFLPRGETNEDIIKNPTRKTNKEANVNKEGKNEIKDSEVKFIYLWVPSNKCF